MRKNRFSEGECAEPDCSNFDAAHRWEFKHFCQNELSSEGCFISESQDADHCSTYYHHKRECALLSLLSCLNSNSQSGADCPVRKASVAAEPRRRARNATIPCTCGTSSTRCRANLQPLQLYRRVRKRARILTHRTRTPSWRDSSPTCAATSRKACMSTRRIEKMASEHRRHRMTMTTMAMRARRLRHASAQMARAAASCCSARSTAESSGTRPACSQVTLCMCALNDHRCVCAELTESKHELQNPIRDWWLSPNLQIGRAHV
mgnify:CR=1 FL=1